MCSIYRASCECDFRQSRVDLALKKRKRENKSVHTLRYVIEKKNVGRYVPKPGIYTGSARCERFRTEILQEAISEIARRRETKGEALCTFDRLSIDCPLRTAVRVVYITTRSHHDRRRPMKGFRILFATEWHSCL